MLNLAPPKRCCGGEKLYKVSHTERNEVKPAYRETDCHIYSIVVKLDKNGFSHRIESIDCVETDRMYVTSSRRISKSKIMKIDTRMIESHKWQHFFTYCVEGQQQEALDMLKAHIIQNMTRIKSEVDALCKWLT